MTSQSPARGRSLSDPDATAYRMELMSLDAKLPVTVLTAAEDPEAEAFGAEVADFLRDAGRQVQVQAVRCDPPFRGLQLYAGEDKVQVVIGHSMRHGPSFLWPLAPKA
ncbi:hypothetical protein [Brevundimonas sp.]|uniref:hypothetical protein n=1 Tax=Brevundimonas sp. TaxID=1871086 RepID=UPI0025DC9429|nr:hypothetical protein [Brevundimonas sp.]